MVVLVVADDRGCATNVMPATTTIPPPMSRRLGYRRITARLGAGHRDIGAPRGGL